MKLTEQKEHLMLALRDHLVGLANEEVLADQQFQMALNKLDPDFYEGLLKPSQVSLLLAFGDGLNALERLNLV